MEYKISSVLRDAPREWNGPNGLVYYINVMLEGHDKIVSVGKKSPDALSQGDTIYGDIIETDYSSDRFKPSKPPMQSSFKPKDEKQITKNMVWKNLLSFFDIPTMTPDSEQWDTFWGMVELHTEMLLPKELDSSQIALRKGLESGKAEAKTVKDVKKVFKGAEPLPEYQGGDEDEIG